MRRRAVLVWALDVAGVTLLTLAAFLWAMPAGFAVAGLGALLLATTADRPRRRGERT